MEKVKKIVIIEPNSTGGEYLLKCAKKIGLEIHAITHENIFKDIYSDKMKNLIDYIFFTDFCCEDVAIQEIVNYCKDNNIDGVVAGFEFVSDITVKVASKLDLPTHEVEKCNSFRRKDLMHKYFNEYKVPCAETIVVNNIDSCVSAVERIGFPAIIKPSSNAGSLNVFKVNNFKEVNLAYNEILKSNIEFPHGIKLDNNILIQEYLSGREVSVEVVVVEGDVEVLAITDKITTKGKYFAEIGHTLPANITKEEAIEVIEVAKLAGMALGLKNGIGHIEVMLTKAGAKIIEIGARMPGDKIPELLFNSYGIDIGKIYMQVAMGERPNLEKTKDKYSAIRFITSTEVGKIQSIEGIEDIDIIKNNEEDGVKSVSIYLDKGASIDVPKNNIQRIGDILSIASNYSALCFIANDSRDKIKVNINKNEVNHENCIY